MSSDRITLEEAKAEIRAMMPSTTMPGSLGFSHEKVIRAQALQYALSILARVHVPEPSEEDRAVLWLIREWQWTISRNIRGWLKVAWAEGDYIVRTISPIEEAKKLGWGGEQ